jgi:hypothetical protein
VEMSSCGDFEVVGPHADTVHNLAPSKLHVSAHDNII